MKYYDFILLLNKYGFYYKYEKTIEPIDLKCWKEHCGNYIMIDYKISQDHVYIKHNMPGYSKEHTFVTDTEHSKLMVDLKYKEIMNDNI